MTKGLSTLGNNHEGQVDKGNGENNNGHEDQADNANPKKGEEVTVDAKDAATDKAAQESATSSHKTLVGPADAVSAPETSDEPIGQYLLFQH